MVQIMRPVSPQRLWTGDLALQHVAHGHSHGLVADALVVVLAVPWVALLQRKDTHKKKILSQVFPVRKRSSRKLYTAMTAQGGDFQFYTVHGNQMPGGRPGALPQLASLSHKPGNNQHLKDTAFKIKHCSSQEMSSARFGRVRITTKKKRNGRVHFSRFHPVALAQIQKHTQAHATCSNPGSL